MKLSQALREVARLHAAYPRRAMFKRGICCALDCVGKRLDIYDLMYDELGEPPGTWGGGYAPWGDWTARPWMCLILAEYLEETGR